MQSLRKRLGPIKDDVLKITREKGRSAGMEFAGIKSVIAFSNWLARPDVVGNPDYGLQPEKPETRRSNYWVTLQGLVDTDNLIARQHQALGAIRADIERLEQERRLKLWQLEQLSYRGEPRYSIDDMDESLFEKFRRKEKLCEVIE